MKKADLPPTVSRSSETSRRLVWLDHASVMTTRLSDAIAFYTEFLGLAVSRMEEDPIRPGHQRAMLVDHHGHEVLELIELPELEHPVIPGRGGLHHLGFRLPLQDWYALRTRLDAASYDYQELEHRLFIRDADGLLLEIEQASDG